MSYLGRARCAVLLSFTCLFTLSGRDCSGQPRFALTSLEGGDRSSEATDSLLTGSILDPSGARIPHARVTIHSAKPDEPSIEVAADSEGYFSVRLTPGDYTLTAAAPGFAPDTITFSLNDSTRHVTLSLPIATRAEQVLVPIDPAQSTAASDNASAVVFSGANLSTFSDDDEVFQKEIASLAGVSGQNAEIFVNGFSAKIPPKQTIREIRINANPYSAAYDRIGVGRVEIFSRPGGDRLHGSFQLSANDSAMNAQNPYTGYEPPYRTLDYSGNLNGPLGKKNSFFLYGAQNIHDFNSLVNAYTLGAAPEPISEAVATPLHHMDWTTRFDRQMSAANTFTATYVFDQANVTEGGLTGQVLPEAGYDSGTTTQTLQLIENEVFSPTLALESRFQYVRTRLTQNAFSTNPSIVIEGVSTGGGNAQQSLHDNQDAFEFDQTLTADRGPHLLHFGARYRLQREANLTTADYNGQYTYPSIAAYLQNAPTQYSYTTGKDNAAIFTGDLGAYAEDEWRLAENFTLDLGFRLESQSAIPDHLDLAPRAGFAWAIKANKKQFLTVRGGSGFFYDRFPLSLLVITVRQNGVSQQVFIENFGTPGASAAAVPPTTYSLEPHLKGQASLVSGLTLERTLGRRGRASVAYSYTGGWHQWISENINAPEPGTGIRPLGSSQNIYEATSNANWKMHLLKANVIVQTTKWMSLWGVGTFQNSHANTAAATSFPSNEYNLRQDYGRVASPTKSLVGGSTFTLPWKISTDLYYAVESGAPFDITTGSDLNGDGIYNDRPAFATNPTASSILYRTRLGTFDANPQPGEAIIPKNYGNSPNFYFVQLTARKRFPVGPRQATPPIPPGVKGPSALPPRKWAIGLTAEAANLLNTNNPAPPIGVLNSPYFGKSITLNNPFGANPAANRTLTLRTSFTF